jgi:ribosomal protein S18 acetylase RimI-like enzyme
MINVRAAQHSDIPAIARVHVDSWRTTYRGIVADAYLDALSYQTHEERHQRYIVHPGTFYLVAELPPHGVVGFLSGGPERNGDNRFAGELYAIYLLKQHQRAGIGKALVQHWAAKLRQEGMGSALVWVLVDNTPAVNFYQRLNAKLVAEQMIEIGGRPLKEFAFGWEDLSGLFGIA